MSKCVVCGRDIKPYQGKNRTRCGSCNTAIRRLRTKLKAIEYLGGECIRCGYKEHPAALEFHHTNPEEKEFSFGNMSNKSWDSVVGELNKCVLLCANCHAVEHSSRYRDALMSELNVYGIRKEKEEYRCTSCNKSLSSHNSSGLCKACYIATYYHQEPWPDREEVQSRVALSGYSAAGRSIGVSDNAVRKFLSK